MMSIISTNGLFGLLAVSVALAAAVTDVRKRLIPNWLTGPAMLGGLVLHWAVAGWGDLAHSLLAGFASGAVFFVFYYAGGMGAGDVKLIGVQAALLGLNHTVPLLLFTALCGGAMGLTLAMVRGRMRETLANVFKLVGHHSCNGLQPHPDLNLANTRTLRLPYALAIAAGTLLTVYLPGLAGAAR